MDSYERDGLVFDVTDSGPAGGEPVVLLHGWPQNRSAWAEVTPRLADAGLRTLAPDQRGYSPRARPAGRAAYRMSELVRDVEALLDAAGLESAHLCGHDWGGALAWAFAGSRPGRTRTLTVLSTPHPAALQWAFLHGDQALRSGYLLVFQVPALPELFVRHGLAPLLRQSGLTDEAAQRYAAWQRQPGAAEGGLGWYRGIPASRGMRSAARPSAAGPSRRITVPTTYLWGRHDVALGRAAAERTARHVSGDYRFVELDAGHWLPEREPDAVAREIVARAATA